MQVISLSRLFCGFIVRNAANGGSGRVYILSITVINTTLKHYLWAVLIFELLFFLSPLLSQYREKLKKIFKEAGHYTYFLLTFL